MKSKIAIVAAILLAAATFTSVKTFIFGTTFLEKNVEALTDGENPIPQPGMKIWKVTVTKTISSEGIEVLSVKCETEGNHACPI